MKWKKKSRKKKKAKKSKKKHKMAINFKPFNILFAPAYQLTYISVVGHIDVGPYIYSVFHYYTTTERQIIFQVCKKFLQWEITQKQEEWERMMYMYQFVIKSPPPFPYLEYPLSEEIIMTVTWEFEGTIINAKHKEISVLATRTDSESSDPSIVVGLAKVSVRTNSHKNRILDTVYNMAGIELQRRIDNVGFQTEIDALELQAKTNLEARDN